MTRWTRFLLAIALGLVAGLYYGRAVNPVEIVDAAPNMLHPAYQTDYVLMVAEMYQTQADLAQAARRLAILGDTPPLQLVQEALAYANTAGYAETDKMLLQNLQVGLQTWNPLPEALQP